MQFNTSRIALLLSQAISLKGQTEQGLATGPIVAKLGNRDSTDVVSGVVGNPSASGVHSRLDIRGSDTLWEAPSNLSTSYAPSTLDNWDSDTAWETTSIVSVSSKDSILDTCVPGTVLVTDRNPSTAKLRTILEEAAMQYKNLTGEDLTMHPCAAKLANWDSVDTVLEIFRDQAQGFSEFRKGNKRLMTWLNPVVHTLITASGPLGGALGGVGLED